MFNPRVQLKSGGYIIINQTEALVAIDVNSGRSTRESNIEDTAHKTNLEAAEEIARQLRLRDLAGLIVIDFIDMEENRNDRAVERRLKDCLRHDRARIQLGRISPFGLLEMSRQRLRPGMVEGSTIACPHCNGTGLIRSVESLALRALRQVEEEAQSNRTDGITVRVPTEVAVYILNHKRADIGAMEERLGLSIFVEAKPDMYGADCEVEIGAPGGFRSRRASQSNAVSAETALAMMPEASFDASDDEDEPVEGESNIEEVETREPRERRERDDRGGRGGRRRRGGRGRDRDDRERRPAAAPADGAEAAAEGVATEEVATSEGEGETDATAREGARDGGDRRRRRRGRRGGRRNGRPEGGFAEGSEAASGGDGEDDADAISANADGAAEAGAQPREEATPAAPKRDKSSATAAIARFFGFGARNETPAAEEKPQAAVAPAIVSTPEPVTPPAPAPEPVAVTPVEEKPDEAAPVEMKPDAVAAHDPVPEAAAVAPEPATPEPEQVAAAIEPTPAAIDPVPAPVEPPARVFIVPEVEKSEVIVVGATEAGPAKAGWWKKRDE
ncbi:MAG: ribonuclease E/G [Micropepsaceae bacterium]